MSLSAAEKLLLNKLESQLARKGVALGDLLDKQLGNPVVSVDPGDAGSLSSTAELEEIESAGVESRVLPAPPAGFVGMKVIRFKTDGGNVTLAGTNVLTKEALTYTFANVGDTLIVKSNGGGKWVEVGTNLTAA